MNLKAITLKILQEEVERHDRRGSVICSELDPEMKLYCSSNIADHLGSFRITLVNSRAKLNSSPGDYWVEHSMKIVKSLAGDDVFVGGLGMLHYSFPLYLWLRNNGCAIVVLESLQSIDSGQNKGLYSFFLNHPKIAWIVLNDPSKLTRSTQQSKNMRDRIIIELSNTVYVGSVRSGGRMDSLLRETRKSGKKIHQTEDRTLKISPWSKIDDETHKTGIRDSCSKHCYRQIFEEEFNQYIWHFTRRRSKPWPGQGWNDYFDGFTGEGEPVPYTALQSLRRIVDQQRIYAHSHLIREKYNVVCFTGNDLQNMKSLFHWQVHLGRPRFEPYALGIARPVAARLGIYPVKYGDFDFFTQMDTCERYLYQNPGEGSQPWRGEREWRCMGDLNLRRIDACNCCLIVPQMSDAVLLAECTSIKLRLWPHKT